MRLLDISLQFQKRDIHPFGFPLAPMGVYLRTRSQIHPSLVPWSPVLVPFGSLLAPFWLPFGSLLAPFLGAASPRLFLPGRGVAAPLPCLLFVSPWLPFGLFLVSFGSLLVSLGLRALHRISLLCLGQSKFRII